jgi:hypothetical protein
MQSAPALCLTQEAVFNTRCKIARASCHLIAKVADSAAGKRYCFKVGRGCGAIGGTAGESFKRRNLKPANIFPGLPSLA